VNGCVPLPPQQLCLWSPAGDGEFPPMFSPARRFRGFQVRDWGRGEDSPKAEQCAGRRRLWAQL
jgi:hypothetical protein